MADVTFVTNVDLANNELRNAKAQVLSTDPTGVEGKFVYNSTDKQLKFYNGTAWVSGGASVANLSGQASAFGQSASNGSAATAARSDHYHALPAHDASAHSAIKLSDLAAPSANLAMGGYKLTGLGAGSANGDSVRYEQVVGVYLPLAGGTLSGVLTVDPTANATDYPVIVKNNITKDSRLFVQRPVGAATAGITLGDSAGKSEAMMHVNNNGLGIALRMNGSTDTSQISFYSGDTLGATVGTTDIGIRAKLVEFQATSVRLPADTTIGANISAAELGYLDGVTSAIQTQLNAKAPSASPTFTGTPAAPTAAVDTNTTQVATTAFVIGQGYLKSSGYTAADVLTKIKTVDGSGSGLDADLLDGQNSSAFAAASHTHAQSDVTNLVSDLAAKAPLASPAFTGTPTAPTPTAGDNSTKIATTAYVDAATSAAASGLDVKNSVRAATSVAGTSPPSGAGADYSTAGVTLANGDRVLVKSQANATRNGIYIVNTGGAWTRATDFDSNADVTRARSVLWRQERGPGQAGF
jgi:hypothetical protein